MLWSALPAWVALSCPWVGWGARPFLIRAFPAQQSAKMVAHGGGSLSWWNTVAPQAPLNFNCGMRVARGGAGRIFGGSWAWGRSGAPHASPCRARPDARANGCPRARYFVKVI